MERFITDILIKFPDDVAILSCYLEIENKRMFLGKCILSTVISRTWQHVTVKLRIIWLLNGYHELTDVTVYFCIPIKLKV